MNEKHTATTRATKAKAPQTPNPIPTTPLEIEARDLALRGIRILRQAYSLWDGRGYDEPDEDSELKHAGPWGEAYAKVCEAVAEIADFADLCPGPDAFAEADRAVGKLEDAERQAKCAVRNARRKAREVSKKANA